MFTRQGLPPAESNQVAVGCELAQEKGLFLSNGSFTLPETDSVTDWVSILVLHRNREKGSESESVQCEHVLHSTM